MDTNRRGGTPPYKTLATMLYLIECDLIDEGVDPVDAKAYAYIAVRALSNNFGPGRLSIVSPAMLEQKFGSEEKRESITDIIGY